MYLEDDTKRPPVGVDEVLLGILELKGNVTAIAERLERPRWVVQKLINETPTLLVAAQDVTESRIDRSEMVIDAYVEKADLNAARLVVTTLGRNRGWTTRSEVTGKDGGAVVVQFEGPENDL